MHPLDGPRLKIRRAQGKIDTLSLAEQAFWSEAKYEIVRAEFNPVTGKDIYRVLIDVVPPLDWGICIGEVVHNLRSALDGLVWQLARLNMGETPAGKTQFPILNVGRTMRKMAGGNKIPHFECDGRRMLRGVHPDHQALIEPFQPYKRPRRGRREYRLHPLLMLREISNADKHRLLQVVGAKPGAITWDVRGRTPPEIFDGVDWNLFDILEDGAPIGEALPTGVDMKPKLVPSVAFGHNCKPVEGMPVIKALSLVADYVVDVVESFTPAFR